MPDLAALQEIAGISFNDTLLLKQALLHSSYVNENPDPAAESNERLEFLGDAVLGLVVAGKLYLDFPSLSEGEMTRLRSAVVRRETLARAAETIKLGDFLFLGKGEAASGGRHKEVNLAGAIEALIAAIYLDQGYHIARQFVLRMFREELVRVFGRNTGLDCKSQLQELVQSRQRLTPVYRLLEAAGPEHERWFKVEVVVNDTVLGTGSGRSKKEAEIEAARAALERLSADFTA